MSGARINKGVALREKSKRLYARETKAVIKERLSLAIGLCGVKRRDPQRCGWSHERFEGS